MITDKSMMALVTSIVVIGLISLACGQLKAPESCGVGGAADQESFGKHFTSMDIVNKATGQTGKEGDEGAEFSTVDSLTIKAASKGRAVIRACIEEREGGGKIVFNEQHTLNEGDVTLDMGTFKKGPYVARVVVDGVLIKNLPFSIK